MEACKAEVRILILFRKSLGESMLFLEYLPLRHDNLFGFSQGDVLSVLDSAHQILTIRLLLKVVHVDVCDISSDVIVLCEFLDLLSLVWVFGLFAQLSFCQLFKDFLSRVFNV